MAWIYLAESADCPLPWLSGSDQSLTVNEIPTVRRTYCRECEEVNCQKHLSGMTCELWSQCSHSQLTSSMAGFPARTSVLLGLELAWVESEVAFSLRSSDSLAIFDQDSFSWKTCQLSLFEDLSGFVWSSLRSGMIRAGRLFQPPQLVPVTDEIDGSCLPTATATAYGYNQSESPNAKRRLSLQSMASRGLLPTPMARDWKGSGGANRESPDLPLTMGGTLNPRFVEEIMGYSIGWTELEDWAMRWFRSKRKRRSKD